MMRWVLLIVFLMLVAVANSQQLSVTGKVKDLETGKMLAGVTVRLQSLTDSMVVRGTITDSSGRFLFATLMPDSFRLYITMVGYELAQRRIKLLTQNTDIGTTAIVNNKGMLAGVTVTANVPAVTQKEDTLQYNASQFKVNPDASAEEMVRKMPGITIENGQVKAQGENVQKVTVDGREFFGDDATAALRNLPAEIIDKIQVFDRLSDQAQFTGVDDGNTTKSINIITKAGMRNGQYGRVYGGYGTDERYSAGGNATFLKNNRRISVVGNFNNVNQQNFSAQDLLGVTSSASTRGGGQRGGGGRQGGTRGNNRPGGNNPGGGNSSNFLVGQQNGINTTDALGLNYSNAWGTKTTLSASYFYNSTNNVTDENTSRDYYLDSLADFSQVNTASSRNTNHRINMRFEHKFDSSNTLLITPSFSLQQNGSDRNALTSFFSQKLNPLSRTRNITNSQRDAINAENNILYRHAFGKRGRTISINLTTAFNNRNGDVYTDYADTSFRTTGYDDSTSGRYTDQYNYGYRLSTNITYTEPAGKNGQLQLSYNPSYNRSSADQQTYQQDVTDRKYSIFNPDFSSRFDNHTTAQKGGIGYRYSVMTKGQLSIGADYQQTRLYSDQDFPRDLSVDKTFGNVLPNAMLRWKFNDRNNVRVNYRTRTSQPSVTQLQDVYDITNTPFITAGNPQLEQQYSHEISTRYTFTNTGKSLLFVANVFYLTANNYITNATYITLRDSVITPTLVMKPGQQLTRPANLDGYESLRSFLTFAMPIKFIKSNFNLNGGVTYAKLPGIINSTASMTYNTNYNLGAVVSSNISEFVDFNISYTAAFNTVRNSLEPQSNDEFFNHTAAAQVNLLSKNGWFLQNDITNLVYKGLAAGYNQNYTLWNVAAGKKFMKNQQAEIRVSVFDVLKQNRSIARDVAANYVEDEQNVVLQQFFMLTFSYNLRNFGKSAPVMRPRGQQSRQSNF